MLVYVLIFLMLFFSAGIFLSYLNKPYWYVRVFDFPLFTEAVGLLLCTIAYVILKESHDGWSTALLIVSGLAFLFAVVKLYRYVPGIRPKSLEAEHDDPLRQVSILNANVRQKNRAIDRFRRVVDDTDADILLLYETDQWWAGQTAYLKEAYPYQVLLPQDNTYGMLLYSRLRLVDHTVNYLCLEGVPSIHAVVELRNKSRFELYVIHPKPPRLYQSTDARDSEIVQVGRKIRETKTPTVLAGDLNDVPWSKALTLFRKMSNTIDPRRGRGFYNTYNAHFPLFRYPLDFFQFNSEFRVVEFRRAGKTGSDHFPLYIKLCFEQENSNEDNLYTLDDEARSDAEEIIRQEKRSIFPRLGFVKG